MGVTIFWVVLAAMYLILSIVTFSARRKLISDLSVLDERSPCGMTNAKGELILIPTKLYDALKGILIADIIGFILAAGAAVATIFLN